MNAVARIEDWGDHHHPVWMDYLRIILGVILIIRAFSFAGHQAVVTNYLLSHRLEYLTFMGAQYLILLGIGGGILITLGVLTRFAALVELPIAVASLFFVSIPNGLTIFNTDLIISIAVLFLLLFFLIYGSGPFSFDRYINTHDDI
jgi:uncharacterized membrane protein YphA (DoxX/SURF4 family)